MYKNLLVAFDCSDPSKAALREASGWALKHDGSVTALHVVYFDTEEFSIAPEQSEKRAIAGRKTCEETSAQISKNTGLPIKTIVREGEPPDVVIDVSAETGADLIVMGTYGRKGIKRLLLGSVTTTVIMKSHLDVLVVKKETPDFKGSYKSILLPFDGSGPSRKALATACEMAERDGASVTALYVIPTYEEIEFFKTESIQNSLKDEAKRILNHAKEIASGMGGQISVEVLEGSASNAIIEASKRNRNDLIIMGSHGYRGVNRALLGNTSERVITHSTCPVLVIRQAI